MAAKRHFDIPWAFQRIRKAIAPVPKAAMFELADDGFDSLFEQLIACLISIRTRDETTIPVARRFFERARTPAQVAGLTTAAIAELIRGSTFREAKARDISALAKRAVREFSGSLPCDFEVLTSFRGVGPKCANLALGIACRQPAIGVDVHVHRVTNRWGFVREATPEKTMRALERKLPREYWVEINRLLVPFGKHVCTSALPKCSSCPVLSMCRQVGVARHR